MHRGPWSAPGSVRGPSFRASSTKAISSITRSRPRVTRRSARLRRSAGLSLSHPLRAWCGRRPGRLHGTRRRWPERGRAGCRGVGPPRGGEFVEWLPGRGTSADRSPSWSSEFGAGQPRVGRGCPMFAPVSGLEVSAGRDGLAAGRAGVPAMGDGEGAAQREEGQADRGAGADAGVAPVDPAR
jgi:hypothetical protein